MQKKKHTSGNIDSKSDFYIEYLPDKSGSIEIPNKPRSTPSGK